jgi:hypothetical protein
MIAFVMLGIELGLLIYSDRCASMNHGDGSKDAVGYQKGFQ